MLTFHLWLVQNKLFTSSFKSRITNSTFRGFIVESCEALTTCFLSNDRILSVKVHFLTPFEACMYAFYVIFFIQCEWIVFDCLLQCVINQVNYVATNQFDSKFELKASIQFVLAFEFSFWLFKNFLVDSVKIHRSLAFLVLPNDAEPHQ